MNRETKIIAFDFDRTLFDTERFKIALSKSLKKYGVSEKTWFKTYTSSIPASLEKYQIYKPKKHAQILSSITGLKTNIILDSFHNIIKQTSKFLYKDSKKILKFFKKRNFKIFLVTFGDKKHQKEKIAYSKIDKCANKIIITQKPKASVRFPKNTILVDDNILEIKNLYRKQGNKMTLVWLNRNSEDELPPEPITVVNDLKSLLKIF